MNNSEPVQHVRSGRGARSRRKKENAKKFFIQQRPFHKVVNSLPIIDVVDEEAIVKIEDAAFTTLEKVGMSFLSPQAVDILTRHGASVDGDDKTVLHFDRDMVREKIKTVPSEFEISARNPAHNIKIGGRNIIFLPVGSNPNCSDLEGGRRPGNYEDFIKFTKLGQFFESIHSFSGYSVEPQDVHASIRHLRCLKDQLILGDKVIKTYALGRERLEDSLEMVRLAKGLSYEEVSAKPHLWTVINTSSPLRLDLPMSDGVIFMAQHGQVSVITPFTLSGAMAPATIPGALVMQHAEFLASAVLSQCVCPGAPIVYGSFTSNVDMRSGSPAFGTPEHVKASQVSGQLARRLNVPLRLTNATASNAVDYQAAQETMMSMWSCLTANANVVMHSAGWLEGGLTASFEKFVIDASMLDAITVYLQPMVVNDDTLALDAISEIGCGGHFFGAAHTMERYTTAFHEPFASDWSNFGLWTENGARDSYQRANAMYHDIINHFEAPPMDSAHKEALESFSARRIAEGGVKTDF